MKAYNKHLNSEFIEHLNSLYSNRNSWWRKIVDDDQIFILVRNNHLRVLVHGGLLMQVEMRYGNIVCKTHEEYLSLRTEKDPYVILKENKTDPFKCVQGLEGFVKHYSKIKRRISQFVSEERKGCHKVSLNIDRMIDKESGLVLENEGENRNAAQFVDIAGITDDGLIVYFETKLLKNSEIKASKGKMPRVINQLKKYEEIIKKDRQKITNAFHQQFDMWSKLKGQFFEKRKRFKPKKISLYPDVRLIVTGFDSAQLKQFIPVIRRNVEMGMGWNHNSPNIITVGNPGSIKEQILFKGIV